MRTSCCRPMHCRWNTTGAFFDPPTALYHSYHGTRKVPLGWIGDHSKAYSSLELTVVIAWSENKAPRGIMMVYVCLCTMMLFLKMALSGYMRSVCLIFGHISYCRLRISLHTKEYVWAILRKAMAWGKSIQWSS